MLVSQLTYSQTSKGNWMTGGSLFFSNSETETIAQAITLETSTLNINVNASGAYFIIDKLAVGAGLGYSYSAYTNNYEPLELTDHYKLLAAEINSRYYFVDEQVFKLWAGFGCRMGWGQYDDYYTTSDGNGFYFENVNNDKTQTFSLGIGPGIAVMITPKLSLDVYLGSLGYSTANYERLGDSYHYKNETFGFSFAQNFGFGLNYHFIK